MYWTFNEHGASSAACEAKKRNPGSKFFWWPEEKPRVQSCTLFSETQPKFIQARLKQSNEEGLQHPM
jgi:hypothetical protein